MLERRIQGERGEESCLVEFKHIILVITLGLLGLMPSHLGKYFFTIGKFYLSLIQLCIIPIIGITVIRIFEDLIRYKASFSRIGRVFF